MKVLAVIPARYGSTRFPGKALADATGRPLVQHVFEQVSNASSISRIIVATDDTRIHDAVISFGGEAMMTRVDHPNGSCRIAEVVDRLVAENEIDRTTDIVVNVQGDEPELDPMVIDAAVTLLLEQPDEVQAATVASPFAAHEQPENPNIVKVVVDQAGRALYFSRSIIPHDRDGEGFRPLLKHIGLYAYRASFLAEYVNLAPSPLEQAERLEQLRVLEHGYRMVVAICRAHHHGIDTPEQYAAFVERWRERNSGN